MKSRIQNGRNAAKSKGMEQSVEYSQYNAASQNLAHSNTFNLIVKMSSTNVGHTYTRISEDLIDSSLILCLQTY